MQSTSDLVAQLVADEAFQSYCLLASEQQRAYWAEWAGDNQERREAMQTARTLVLKLHLRPTDAAVAAAYQKLQDRHPDLQTNPATTPPATRRIFPRMGWAVAAALAALAVAVVLLLPKDQEPVFVQETTDWQLDSLYLPDGSLAILNVNSSLRYAEDWNKEEPREVWLEGEAFFEVTNEPLAGSRQFRVYTPEGRVEVLGTAFNLYQRSGQFEVVLQEGRLQVVSEDGGSAMLTPGERAWLGTDGTLVTEAVVPASYTNWLVGRLVFKDISLEQISRQLADNFQLNLSIPDPALRKKRVSATINDGDPFALVDAIATIYDLAVTVSPDSTAMTLTKKEE